MSLEEKYKTRISELEERVEDLNDFIENASIPLHWVNEEGIITWANQAELNALGYSKEEYIGQPISQFHADKKIIHDILSRLGKNETLNNYAAILKCKSGELKHVLINSNVRRKNGKFLHTRCFTRDVSEIVRHSEKRELLLRELEKKNDEIARSEKRLEAEVKKRTGELVELNELLAQKNEQLNAKNSELLSFNYMAGHDLQGPLRKILSYAVLTGNHLDNNGNEKAKTYLLKISAAAEAMRNLMLSLLEYSKVSTGQYAFVETDLNSILSIVKEDLSEKILEKNVRIVHDQLPVLKIIPFQIQQLFTNLLSNAIKYTKPGVQCEITIKAHKIEGRHIPYSEANKALEYWQIDVADNGLGFKQEYADQVFDLFTRLHNGADSEGTGVGLGICKRIVENHSGFIKAVSNEEKGATFSVFLNCNEQKRTNNNH